jgi:hypothetical protein
MEDLFKQLLEQTDVLNEEAKQQLTEALQAKLEEAITVATAETTLKVRAELTEQFQTEKENLIDALDTKAEAFLQEGLETLHDDIAAFRDVEAEYAFKLVEAKAELAETLKTDMAELIDQLDAFNTKCLQEEFAELEADIVEVKKIKYGMDLFESFRTAFESNFADSNETLNQLKEAEAKLADAEKKLNETTVALSTVARDKKMNEVLEPLQGRSREIMETILKTVPVEKLEEQYERMIGTVLHKVSEKSEKESVPTPVLAEGKKEDVIVEETVIKTGDTAITESLKEAPSVGNIPASAIDRLKVLSGVND